MGGRREGGKVGGVKDGQRGGEGIKIYGIGDGHGKRGRKEKISKDELETG